MHFEPGQTVNRAEEGRNGCPGLETTPWTGEKTRERETSEELVGLTILG